MALRLVTGVPGSGKTFFCVKMIADEYCVEDGTGYKVKDGVTLITNIEGLALPCLSLDAVLGDSKLSIEGFFTVPYQEKVVRKYSKLVYVIDECQRFFPVTFRNRDVLYFFEYHRHLGIDIWLVTQSRELLARGLRELAEIEYRGVRRSASVFGELKYNVICGGEIVDKRVLKKDKGIFALYRSMLGKESMKIRNPIVKYVVLSGIGACLCFWLFTKVFWDGGSKVSASVRSAVGSVAVSGSEGSRGSGPAEDRVMVRLSFIEIGKRLLAVDPSTGYLVPVDGLSVPARVVDARGNRIIEADVPIWMLPPSLSRPRPFDQSNGQAHTSQNDEPKSKNKGEKKEKKAVNGERGRNLRKEK